jgi:adenylate kinase family enzyme
MLFPTICVLGDVKSGKSSLARGLASSLGLVHLTVSKILQAIIDGNEVSSLCDSLKKICASGKTVPEELVLEAVILMTSRVATSGKGYQ